VTLLLGLPLLLTGDSWRLSALVAFLVALLTAVGGAVLLRVAGDSDAGGLIGALCIRTHLSPASPPWRARTH
jgi:hypothetical protein